MRILATLIAAAILAAPAAAAQSGHEADLAALRQLVQQFQAAIIAHDGPALAALFLPEQNSWLSVHDDASLAAARARDAQARKVMPSTAQRFVAFVAASDKPIEERFANVRIDTNGTVAAVYFDFDFLVAGAVTNRGAESWQLVNGGDGWKISSMLYSVGR